MYLSTLGGFYVDATGCSYFLGLPLGGWDSLLATLRTINCSLLPLCKNSHHSVIQVVAMTLLPSLYSVVLVGQHCFILSHIPTKVLGSCEKYFQISGFP